MPADDRVRCVPSLLAVRPSVSATPTHCKDPCPHLKLRDVSSIRFAIPPPESFWVKITCVTISPPLLRSMRQARVLGLMISVSMPFCSVL